MPGLLFAGFLAACADVGDQAERFGDPAHLLKVLALVQVVDPLFEPALGDLAVARLQTAFLPNPVELFAAVVQVAASVAVQAGKVSHLDVQGRLGGSEDDDHEAERQLNDSRR